MIATECEKCGVAYDLGRTYCVELGCGVPLIKEDTALIPIKIPRTKKQAPVDRLYSRYSSVKYRAEKKGIPFSMTQEIIQEILNQPCVYCGEQNGIQLDRKIGEDGYTPDNVVPACKRCNTVKSMYLTHAEMMIVAQALGWNHG